MMRNLNKDFAKYLQVYFEKQLLSWSKHIKITNNKLYKGIGISTKLCQYENIIQLISEILHQIWKP